MNVDLSFLALIGNAIITCFCGGTILFFISVKRFEIRFFYYGWALGFIFYSIQLAIRAFTIINVYQGFFMIVAFIIFSSATWSLRRLKGELYIIFAVMSMMFVLVGLIYLGTISLEIGYTVGHFLFYLPVFFQVIGHRLYFGRAVDKFAFGWSSLFISNLLLFEKGWYVDVFAIFSKIIILLGIMDYDFVVLAQRIKEEVKTRPLPIHIGFEVEGKLKLVKFSPNCSHHKKMEWIKERIQENIKSNVDSYIFLFQNIIPYTEIRRLKWINPAKVFVFIFSSSAVGAREEFSVFSMDQTIIGAALSEVITSSSREKEIFLLDLSMLIHLFGALSVYNLLLSKMGALRENKAVLYAYFCPETHRDGSVVSLFESVSDEDVNL